MTRYILWFATIGAAFVFTLQIGIWHGRSLQRAQDQESIEQAQEYSQQLIKEICREKKGGTVK